MTKELEKLGKEVKNLDKTPKAKKTPKAPKQPRKITLDDLSPEVIEQLAGKLRIGPAASPNNSLQSLVVMEERDTDASDVLAVPATFFTYSMGKTIMDDKRNGRIVVPPFSYKNEEGKIVSMPYHFKKLYATEKQGNARDSRKQWVSVCIERSKVRAEWLRKHSMFNSMFFEDIKKVGTVDVNIQEKLVEASMFVMRLNDNEVILRCQNENLPFETKIDNMRSTLSRHIAYKELENSGNRSQTTLLKSLLAIDSIGKENAKGLMQAH